ncbi:NAD-dependent succinate-semialdehyde dehydrogenase [Kribbella sp. GL6]|uniref:NAD-dependent succinate-semialdehyde dehydrogenase n=1 Tax=Kribbella sp. GL6 TaxID=3419765 RepID=UPI003D05DE34
MANASTALIDAERTGVHIGGRWEDAQSGRCFAVHDPATGDVIAEVADADTADARRALDAAAAAATTWAASAARERSDVLRRAFDAVLDRRDEFAATITREMGKPLQEARSEVEYGAEFLRWYSEEAVRGIGRSGAWPEGRQSLDVRRRPVGLCYLVTPWNFPLAMVTRKIAPALAAGCTAVLKPAELTPLTAMLMLDVLADAGCPPGVVNLLTTSDPRAVSEAVFADSRLRKVSFTGSTAVGRTLLRQAAGQVVRTSMELGGNAPFIVLPGADVAAAVDAAMTAKYRNMGQACTAANRFLVHESLMEEFGEQLAFRSRQLLVGPGTDPATTIGPLITSTAVERSLRLIDDAVTRGASLLTGGRRIDETGNYLEPTVLSGVTPGSKILAEEIFAPVAPISGFASVDDAVRLANDTEYGLAGYVCAPTKEAGQAVAARLEVGMVGINTGVISNAAAPFGGVKSSGMGREGGSEGLDEYLATQYVSSPV